MTFFPWLRNRKRASTQGYRQAAEAMGISRATDDRHWSYAKVFIYCALEDAEKS
jgi:hypothetical protein